MIELDRLTGGLILALILAAALVCALWYRFMKNTRLKWLPATLAALCELAAAMFLLFRDASLEELYLVLLVFAAVIFGAAYGRLPRRKSAKDKAADAQSDKEASDGI